LIAKQLETQALALDNVMPFEWNSKLHAHAWPAGQAP